MDSSYGNQGLLTTHLRDFEIKFLDLSSFLSEFPAEEKYRSSWHRDPGVRVVPIDRDEWFETIDPQYS